MAQIGMSAPSQTMQSPTMPAAMQNSVAPEEKKSGAWIWIVVAVIVIGLGIAAYLWLA